MLQVYGLDGKLGQDPRTEYSMALILLHGVAR